MSSTLSLSATVRAWGTARIDLAAIQPLRKSLPPWAPLGTAGHFLKYADEQTIVAIGAVDRAIQSFGFDLAQHRDWAIIAAPRFLGRAVGPSVLDRYAKGGPQAVSPHVIPNHSLHSVSGAMSILLASRGPNVGVGGGPESLDDAILATFSLPGGNRAAGTWLLASAFSPEPVSDLQGRITNQPVCHAFALAIEFAAGEPHSGELILRRDSRSPSPARPTGEDRVSVARMVADLEAAAESGKTYQHAWRLGWGAEVELCLRSAALPQLAAA